MFGGVIELPTDWAMSFGKKNGGLPSQTQNLGSRNHKIKGMLLQGGPLPIINGVITSINGLING